MEQHWIVRTAPCKPLRGRAVRMAMCLVVGTILGTTSTVLPGKPLEPQPPPAKSDTVSHPAVGKPAAEAPSSSVEQRIREGTPVVDRRGMFKITGDRVTFISSDGRVRLVALENLALERIVRVITDSPEKQEWIVTGAVTEYQGVNYVLVERAVLRSQAESSGDQRQPLNAGDRQ